MGVASRHVQSPPPALQGSPQSELLEKLNSKAPANYAQFFSDALSSSALMDAPGPQFAGFFNSSAN